MFKHGNYETAVHEVDTQKENLKRKWSKANFQDLETFSKIQEYRRRQERIRHKGFI
jgi:hypothetical protein